MVIVNLFAENPWIEIEGGKVFPHLISDMY